MALQKVEICNIINKKEGYKTMSIPSTIHTYSVCIEYMRKWFLSHFEPGFWGEDDSNFIVEGRHAFDDFRTLSKEQMLKRASKYVTMGCQVDLSYDRDRLDLYPFGVELYLSRHSTAERPFFSDKINNMNICQDFEVMLANITFNMKFGSKARQFDMYKYCKMLFRVGATQGQYISYDQHIPYDLMIQVAKDAGFQVANGKIVDILSFVKYMNTHSACPILYKYRNINGKDEFFVRVTNAYVHISIPEIEFDDGERTGQTTSNYGVSFTATVRFPATKCYVYYSENQHTEIRLREEVANGTCFSTIRLIDAPLYNEKMWKQTITTEYEVDEITNECLEIDLSDLLMPGLLGRVIANTNSMKLSPELFMELRFFNAGEEIKFNIDWDTLKARSYMPMKSRRTFIVCYTDMEYINNQVEVIKRIAASSRA